VIRSDKLLGDICDGQFFKEHPIFSCDRRALQLIIYYDEVEICNPLGHARGIHKLGVLLHSMYINSYMYVKIIIIFLF